METRGLLQSRFASAAARSVIVQASERWLLHRRRGKDRGRGRRKREKGQHTEPRIRHVSKTFFSLGGGGPQASSTALVEIGGGARRKKKEKEKDASTGLPRRLRSCNHASQSGELHVYSRGGRERGETSSHRQGGSLAGYFDIFSRVDEREREKGKKGQFHYLPLLSSRGRRRGKKREGSP